MVEDSEMPVTKVLARLDQLREDVRLLRGEAATKADLESVRADMATKADLESVRADMARKGDLESVRADMATKGDLHALRSEIVTKSRFDRLALEVAIVKTRVENDMVTRSDLAALRKDGERMLARTLEAAQAARTAADKVLTHSDILNDHAVRLRALERAARRSS